MTDPGPDAERLIEAHIASLHSSSNGNVRFLLEQVARLTQERDDLREGLKRTANDHDKAIRERDEARRRAEWLGRIVQWCSKRLRHQSYADTLAAKLAAGATDVPDDEPAIVQSDTTQPPDDVERARDVIDGWYKHIREGGNGNREAWVQHIAAALTEARREGTDIRALDEAAVIEGCAKFIDDLAVNIRDCGRWTNEEGIITAITGTHVGALLDAASELRRLARDAARP